MNSKDNGTKSGESGQGQRPAPGQGRSQGHDQGPGHEEDREHRPECGWDRRRHQDWGYEDRDRQVQDWRQELEDGQVQGEGQRREREEVITLQHEQAGAVRLHEVGRVEDDVPPPPQKRERDHRGGQGRVPGLRQEHRCGAEGARVWSKDQLAVIRQMAATTLQVAPLTDTRRSVIGPMGDQYCIGLGPQKYDTTGSPRYYYANVVDKVDINGNWLVNQRTSEGVVRVVIECVSHNLLMQQNRTGWEHERAWACRCTRSRPPVQHVEDTSFLGTFAWMGGESLQKTNTLVDVMRMLKRPVRSSLCLATIAISITTTPAKVIEGEGDPRHEQLRPEQSDYKQR
ncbi:hypothetical protein Z517_09287 [Fonsecaea pedrosoi CBS 271.37]|uniref:Uncharacterized protein n=1 Tax=Fonsecaea pedrosoi CBS 271.37 TaxID=1442368 RepID=A0A0D2G826_9EURO|nr:uncharacterized protein Z517_09287 [Fonsecaea pedrosoi CBS 271.37]KIW76843.1 hypothetical protein Z517_09287 [Fonsecaea pedrosoi CBS 271.37]